MNIKLSDLEHNCEKNMEDFPEVRISVMGDCATQHICSAIRGYGYLERIRFNIYESDYNQIDLQLNNPCSAAFQHQPDYIFLILCQEQLYQTYCKTPSESRVHFAEQQLARIQNYWRLISENSCHPAKILQSNFTIINDYVFGEYAIQEPSSYLFQAQKLNYLLMETIGNDKKSDIHLINMDQLQQRFGFERLHDNRSYFVGKLPFATKYLPYLAKQVTDTVKSLQGRIHKCVILDLDNTLWGGIIGDDGIEKIQIGELGEGQAYTRLQLWLKELKNRGIILTVCSKNDEANAKLPFEKHPEMILRLSDIAVFVANWEDKATNIGRIQQILNIGFDSMVFLDDNPFERNLVRSAHPEICVPELPEDASEYLPYLQSLNLFEVSGHTAEDQSRTALYQAESARSEAQKEYADYEAYLESLQMEATISSFDDFQTPRIAQLTQRSNQFNLRTIRYTETEIQQLCSNEQYITLYFTLSDRFGDHGLISVVILEKTEDKALFINEWLMSCRVLNRGMEDFVADTIITTAKENGFSKVIGEYIPTAKNKMVAELLPRMGFQPIDNQRYQADVSTYEYHKTYIKSK